MAIKSPTDTAMTVAASGLRAQQARMRIIAENLANANSTARTAGGDPYRRQIPVFEPKAVDGGQGVKMSRVEPDSTDFKSTYDPGNPAADAKGVRLHVTLDPLAGPVKGDPGRLQQVVWNLLSNAIKFTPKGGRVQVFLERVNSHIEVTVADNGNGIRPEFLPHVFDRFRQADSSTSRRHGGLGLGLSIVKQLVELHGGMVRAKSPGEGLGATFVVDLPLMPLHELPGDGEKPRAHPAAQGPLAEVLRDAQDLTAVTVLVVDDVPDARELVRRLLEDCGATVHTAGSADEAVAALRSRAVSVMVSDIGMPAVDGYELIRRVRALPEKDRAAVPAAAVTAFARPEDRMRAMLAGYDLHLAKPIEPVELVVAVAALARRGAAGRASP